MTNPANLLILFIYLIISIGLSGCSTNDANLRLSQHEHNKDNASYPSASLRGRVLADHAGHFTLKINDTTVTTDAYGAFEVAQIAIPADHRIIIQPEQSTGTIQQVIQVQANQYYYLMIDLTSETTQDTI